MGWDWDWNRCLGHVFRVGGCVKSELLVDLKLAVPSCSRADLLATAVAFTEPRDLSTVDCHIMGLNEG